MNLGTNQLAILRRCYLKGHIGIRDISRYYNMRLCSQNRDRFAAILEKMEIKGLLVQVGEYNWELTVKGHEVVKNKFNLKKEVNQ
jgi:ribosomal protein S19E (S16A)